MGFLEAAEKQRQKEKKSIKPKASGAFTQNGEKVQKVININENQIKFDPNNPRKTISEESIESLWSSIKKHGLRTPVHVVIIKDDKEPEKVEYMLVSGERRLRAIRFGKQKYIKAIVDQDISPSDVKHREVAYIDNSDRDGYTMFDEVRFFQEQMKLESNGEPVYKSISDLARALAGDNEKAFNAKKTRISKFLKIGEMSNEAIEYCREKNYYSQTILYEIAHLPKGVQLLVLKDIITKQMKVKDAIAKVKDTKSNKSTIKQPPLPANYIEKKDKIRITINKTLPADLKKELDALMQKIQKALN